MMKGTCREKDNQPQLWQSRQYRGTRHTLDIPALDYNETLPRWLRRARGAIVTNTGKHVLIILLRNAMHKIVQFNVDSVTHVDSLSAIHESVDIVQFCTARAALYNIC